MLFLIIDPPRLPRGSPGGPRFSVSTRTASANERARMVFPPPSFLRKAGPNHLRRSRKTARSADYRNKYYQSVTEGQ